jgi:glycosyltransferase involved in cell wall biosynthesis
MEKAAVREAPRMKGSDNKVNLLFVLLQMSAGGAERVALNLAENLDKSLFNVYVAFFSGGNLEARFRACTNGMMHIPKKRGFDPNAVMFLARVIRRKAIDVINPHHYAPFFYSRLAASTTWGKRVVYTEHSVPDLQRFTTLYKILNRSLLASANTWFIGVSREVAALMKNTFPSKQEKVICIPNGVAIPESAPDNRVEELRKNLSIGPGSFVIGTVANFRRVKNHACLIRAFRSLAAVRNNVCLVLVGKGYPGDTENTEKEIMELVLSYGLERKVIFTGYRENVGELLPAFDLFCLPSFSEGLPLSVLEAMARRVPVVGSDVRGIREVVLQGETGMLFPSNDDGALAQVLQALMENKALRQRLAENGFLFVEREHGLGQWVRRHERLFAGIAGHHERS